MTLLSGMQDIANEMVSLRHHIHQHPELGFKEYNTAELVASKLKSWGYTVSQGIAKTGVIAQLKTGEGPTIGLRADMDALPILEENTFNHKSKNDGVMHACGHDGHTATLLAAAKYLAENPHFKGTVNLFFQPAEEGLGGAREMIKEGCLKQFPCDAMFAYHNMPGYPAGHFGFRKGAIMASSDKVTVKIKGQGGHGAMPHTTVDPVVVAASIIMALQTVPARNVNPLHSTVISVGSVQSGNTFNVIPDTATLLISIRNLDPTTQDLVEKRVKELIHAQAQSYGASAEIDYFRSYPILINQDKATAFAEEVAHELLEKETIIPNFPPLCASEDFSFFANECPACYFFVGNGTSGTGGCSIHNPHYDFNDELIPTVASYWVQLVYRFCPK